MIGTFLRYYKKISHIMYLSKASKVLHHHRDSFMHKSEAWQEKDAFQLLLPNNTQISTCLVEGERIQVSSTTFDVLHLSHILLKYVRILVRFVHNICRDHFNNSKFISLHPKKAHHSHIYFYSVVWCRKRDDLQDSSEEA